MKKTINKLLVNHSLVYRVFLYVAAVILVVFLFPKNGQFKFEFQKGKPWQYDNYYAPFNFAIQKTEGEIAAEKETINKSAKQYFDVDKQVPETAMQNVMAAINKMVVTDSFSVNALKKIKENSKKIILSVYKSGLISDGEFQKINTPAITLKTGNVSEEVLLKKLFRQKDVSFFIRKNIGKEPFTTEETTIIDMLYNAIKPNVFYNKSFSDNILEERISEISYTKGLVEENERIIFKGDIVEGEKLQKLNSLKKEFESQVWSKSNYNWIVFGYTILIALAFLMLLLFLRKYRLDIFENNSKLTFIFFNTILIVLLITLVVKYDSKYVYIVPIVILPLVLKAFFDARLGLFVHVLTVLLLGFIVPNSFEFIFVQIIAGIVTILTISEMHKRANLFISVLQITLIYFLSFFAFSIIQEGNASNLNWNKFLYFTLNGAATLFVLPLIYIFEKLFGLVSDESLKELSNTNSKLLRELAEKAPGTFQHSLQVANLAEACAIEIKANAMLVRTGALYHDIGKMLSPMYYTENQSTTVNPHNELTPRDSAQIIIGHIIKGVELAKKNRLPDRIIDFIRTHHGTSLVYYFYKMEEQNEGVADEKYFRYPGPIPFSKETAILMMCDSVEAASKSIKAPSAQVFDDLVEKIVNSQMENKQFMNADITFKELKQIKKVLKKKLKNIYHLRIEYPE